MSLLITNATLVTMTDMGIRENSALLIDGATIADYGDSSDLITQYPDADVIDARGSLVMPAGIVAHTHFYGAYARGMAIPGPAPKDFPEILERLWWPLDKALDADSIRMSALIFMVDAIKHGVTTLFDHHASPNHIVGSLDIIGDAVEMAGLRAVLCYEVTDRDGAQKARQGIEENVRFIKANAQNPHLRGAFGLHASLTLSDITLEACHEAMQGLTAGFHVHAAEHEADEYDSLQKSGKRVIQRLYDYGILGEKSIVAHAVHCNAWELDLLRETGTWVSHQPRSNMNNAVGAAAIDTMLEADMRICLGTDGFSNNLWAEWKAAYFLHKIVRRDPRRAPGDGIAHMALHNNARLAEAYFPGMQIGTLAKGAVADVVVVDYHPHTPLTAGNLPWHIIFGFEASMVRTTIASGQILMLDRELLTLNEAEIARQAREIAPQVWERYEQFANAALDSSTKG